MRKIVLMSIILLVAGCGDQTGPVTVTPEMEAQQRANEERVHEAETEWQKYHTTGDQEVEARQRNSEEYVRQAEMEWQKRQPMPDK
jgi:hypothetical protein